MVVMQGVVKTSVGLAVLALSTVAWMSPAPHRLDDDDPRTDDAGVEDEAGSEIDAAAPPAEDATAPEEPDASPAPEDAGGGEGDL